MLDKKCPRCEGDGTITCPRCNGNRVVQRDDYTPWLDDIKDVLVGDGSQETHEECTNCEGSGEVVCSKCDGNGVIDD